MCLGQIISLISPRGYTQRKSCPFLDFAGGEDAKQYWETFSILIMFCIQAIKQKKFLQTAVSSFQVAGNCQNMRTESLILHL